LLNLAEYNITLQHAADIPVVDISGKNSKRPNYLPAELCEIEPGQPYLGKLDAKETANMIRYACNPPGVNADAIVNRGLPILGLAPQSLSSTVNGFDISISTEMTVIPARELQAPKLSYKAGSANVRDGSWNILNVKFHRGGIVANWWVLVVRDGPASIINKPDDPQLTSLCRGFAEKCRASGMAVPHTPPRILAAQLLPPSTDPSRTGSINQIRQTIQKSLDLDKGKKPSFILVLLSRVDNYIYPGIKRLGDVELGIHTVHMLLEKALKDPKKQDQYFSNVALKLNTKLGGINHLLDNDSTKWLTSKKTMIVGMDVTHPGPTSVPGTPSIAAVVASVDDTFVQFPASMRIQKGKTEVCDRCRAVTLAVVLLECIL
jgi:eukaryotic translation initiation factor 2C